MNGLFNYEDLGPKLEWNFEMVYLLMLFYWYNFVISFHIAEEIFINYLY